MAALGFEFTTLNECFWPTAAWSVTTVLWPVATARERRLSGGNSDPAYGGSWPISDVPNYIGSSTWSLQIFLAPLPNFYRAQF